MDLLGGESLSVPSSSRIPANAVAATASDSASSLLRFA